MKFEKIIKHKYLYYAACALAAINLLGYVSMGSMECIILFGASVYAANHFTKNRALDIFVGLFVSNVLCGCGRIKDSVKEGMKNSGDSALDLVKQWSTDVNKSKGLPKEKAKCVTALDAALVAVNALK